MTLQFKPMLAAQFDEARVVKHLQSSPLYVQPKYDGIRVTLTPDGPRTRSLKNIPNRYIRDYLQTRIDMFGRCRWLDGEIMTYDDLGRVNDYNTIQSEVMSAAGTPKFRFHAFDVAFPMHTFRERLTYVQGVYQDYTDWMNIAPTIAVRTLEELYAHEELLLTNNYEGVIIRHPESMYKHGRATAVKGELVKLKRFEDAEGSVIGFEELMHNDNEAFTNELGYTDHTSHKANLRPGNKLGKLVVKLIGDEDNPRAGIEVRLGSGFTDAQRIEIWQNQAEYMGKIAKFKWFPHGTKDKPRHPIFLGWRSPFDL